MLSESFSMAPLDAMILSCFMRTMRRGLAVGLMLVKKLISDEFVEGSTVDDIQIFANIINDNELMYVHIKHESKKILTTNIL